MIPRILHHIWLHAEPMSPGFLRSVDAWRRHHPGWKQFIWTEGHLPQLSASSAFYSLRSAQARSELLRMELLYQFGGIVILHDVEPTQSLDEIAAGNYEDPFVFRDNGDVPLVAGRSGHPLFAQSIRLGLRLAGRTRVGDADSWLKTFKTSNFDNDSFQLCQRLEELRCIRSAGDGSHGPKCYQPERLVIAVRTIHREPQYIHQTLASMFVSDDLVRRTGEVLLLIGNEADDYLSNYLHHTHLRIMSLTRAQRQQFSALNELQDKLSPLDSNRQRFNFNFIRSLRLPLSGKLGVLSCEDDVIFRENFLQSLLAAIHEVEEGHGISEYMLSLSQYYDFERDSNAYLGKHFCRYSRPFYGTQAVFFPTSVAAKFADYVDENGIGEGLRAGDILAGEFFKDTTFSTVRPLVQHIGEVSTGLGGTSLDKTRFHRPLFPCSPDDWGSPPPPIIHVPAPW